MVFTFMNHFLLLVSCATSVAVGGPTFLSHAHDGRARLANRDLGLALSEGRQGSTALLGLSHGAEEHVQLVREHLGTTWQALPKVPSGMRPWVVGSWCLTVFHSRFDSWDEVVPRPSSALCHCLFLLLLLPFDCSAHFTVFVAAPSIFAFHAAARCGPAFFAFRAAAAVSADRRHSRRLQFLPS